MNFKLVLRTYSQLRQLSDDETALLETLRGMSDADRELLAETLGPPVKAKVKAGTTRKYQRCEVCNLTRRADTHNDKDLGGFHEFVTPESSAKKSKRGLEIAERVKGAGTRQLDGGVSKMRCAHAGDNGGSTVVCGEYADNPIHDALMGYAGYHEFDSGQQVAVASGD